MNRTRLLVILAGSLTALALGGSASRTAPAPQPGEVVELGLPPDRAGEYRLDSDPNGRVVVERLPFEGAILVRTSQGWGAIGFFEREHFEGVVRSADLQGSPLPGPIGTLVFDVRAGGRIEAMIRRGGLERTETWLPDRVARDELPAPGDYVPVDELPVAIQKPGPVYPPEARKAGIQGTVMVQVLVGKDGIPGDVRIARSIPELDAAALACVRNWRFKPAVSGGRQVPMWVAIPVKFTLK